MKVVIMNGKQEQRLCEVISVIFAVVHCGKIHIIFMPRSFSFPCLFKHRQNTNFVNRVN